MNLNSLLDSISEIAYDIDVKNFYKFAREDLNMSSKEAKIFAVGAAEEQKQLDIEASRKRKRDKKLRRIAERRNLLLASRAQNMNKKIEKKEDDLGNLLDELLNLRI